MKVCMSSWSYHPLIEGKQMDQLFWIRLCKELELDGAELLDIHFPNLSKEYVTQVKKLVAECGLEVPMCSVSNDFGKATEAERAASEKQVETWINAAAWFGARFLRVFAGWPGQHDAARHAVEKEKLWPEMIQRFQRVSKLAEDKGIMLALENHNHLGFTQTFEDLDRIITEVGSDWLCACLDTGDYLVDTADKNGYAALEKAMAYTRIVHAKFYELDEEGRDKKQDWAKIFKILEAAVYDDWISIEYEGKDCKNDVPRAARWLLDQTAVTGRSRR